MENKMRTDSVSESLRMIKVRRGCVISASPSATWWEQDEDVHNARLHDAAERSAPAVAVLQSAVLLHGGQLKHVPNQAHVWVPWRRKTRSHTGPTLRALSRSEQRERLAQRPVVNHRMDIDLERTVVIDGIRVTDLNQTAVLAARFLPVDDAVIAVDSLLAIAVGRDRYWRDRRAQIESEARGVVARWVQDLEPYVGRRGVAQAREVFASASALAESPVESEARRIAHAAGFRRIEPQVEVRTKNMGRRWVDLGIPGVPRGIEIHGDVKFEGENGEAQAIHERERENELLEVGFKVVRLTGRDVFDSRLVVDALDRCFGEYRQRNGLRRLWTGQEVRRGRPSS